MTLFKLSVRNIKKSIKDYIVYFVTLILGVALFYVFNAIEKQTAMLVIKGSGYQIMDTMFEVMSIVGAFVAVVLGFLVVYASNFLMKRRKKEFAVYMLLGMSKQKISAVIVIETILIGIISLGVGLLAGIGMSQGMSLVVANLFEVDMTGFRFVISGAAVLKTLLYFVKMYFLVIMFDVFVVGKAKLINLINAGKHTERNYAKNPIVCIVVFVIAAILLGTAYYKVTAGAYDIANMGELGLEIVKGIVGTFLAFWSVSGMLIFFAGKNKRFYYKKINCFGVNELGSRINSNVFSGGIICLMLFLTISVLSCSFAVRNGMNKTFNDNVQADVMIRQVGSAYNFENGTSSICELLISKDFDMDKFSEYDEIYTYGFKGVKAGVMSYDSTDKFDFDFYFDVIRVSDYNRLAALYKRTPLSVGEDEYILLSDFKLNSKFYDEALAKGQTLDICGKTYRTKYDSCLSISVEMSNTESNQGTIVVPDSCNFEAYRNKTGYIATIFIANYKDMPKDELEELDEYLMSEEFKQLIQEEDRPWIDVKTKSYFRQSGVSLTAVTIFIGLYLGIVFLISAAAIFSLKELSSAVDNRGKYEILRKIGVDEKMINRSLMCQSLIFFGLPLLLAVIHSIFGIQTGMFILASFSHKGLIDGILIASSVIIAVYMLYFLVTYYCSKEIISS